MSKTHPHRLYRRLFVLSLLLACLSFLSASPAARADGDCCISQYNTCNSGCAPVCDPSGCYSDYNCEMQCNNQYATCSAPGGGGTCYQQPEEPCPGCAEACDVMQQECVDSGGDPRSCVFAGVRCRQSCYVGCPQ